MTFYWLTPFVESFVTSNWLELVIYFQTKEPYGEQNASQSTFQTTMIYDKVLRQVCATFGMETFQEKQQKAIGMFFEGNDVSVSSPTGH